MPDYSQVIALIKQYNNRKNNSKKIHKSSLSVDIDNDKIVKNQMLTYESFNISDNISNSSISSNESV